MSVQLNHTIVWCRDKEKSAAFLTDALDLPGPTHYGPFLVVELSNAVSLDFYETTDKISPQHYAFLVGEEDFDESFDRICSRGIPYWADPGKKSPGEINRHDGGRGVYFDDPDGHFMEMITRPYGSGD